MELRGIKVGLARALVSLKVCTPVRRLERAQGRYADHRRSPQRTQGGEVIRQRLLYMMMCDSPYADMRSPLMMPLHSTVPRLLLGTTT